MRNHSLTIRSLIACACLAGLCMWASADSLTIGSWNIEHCGEPGYEKDAQRLADYIASSGARLIALQEIMITHHDARGLHRNRLLDEVVAHLGPTWRYVIFDTSCTSPRLSLGILFDAAVVRPKAYRRLPTPTDMYREHREANGVHRRRILCRAPVAIWLQTGEGKTDFVLVPIHLKSNRLDDPQPEDRVNHRKVEAELLLAALRKVLPEFGGGNERDIYIAGDTNMLDNDHADMQAFLKADFDDLNASDVGTYAGTSAPFDRFIVADASAEVRRDSFRVHKRYAAEHNLSPDQFRDQYSDHYLVTFEIEIAPDDD